MAANEKHNSSNTLIIVVEFVVVVSVQFWPALNFREELLNRTQHSMVVASGAPRARETHASVDPCLGTILLTDRGEIGAVVSDIKISTIANSTTLRQKNAYIHQ